MNLVSKHALVLGVGAVTAAAALTGCSSSKESESNTGSSTAAASTSAPAAAPAPGPAPEPGAGRVTLNGADLGPVTGVNCQVVADEITITVQSTPKAIMVLTTEATPGVTSVSIGELGSDGPSAAYIPGVSENTPQATHDGNTYTVTGTGNGTDPADPSKPVDVPFEIAATCP